MERVPVCAGWLRKITDLQHTKTEGFFAQPPIGIKRRISDIEESVLNGTTTPHPPAGTLPIFDGEGIAVWMPKIFIRRST
jgi:hypothetical protein